MIGRGNRLLVVLPQTVSEEWANDEIKQMYNRYNLYDPESRLLGKEELYLSTRTEAEVMFR